MLTIILRKKHFLDVSFTNSHDCPLARALKERYKTTDVKVLIRFAWVGEEHRTLKVPYTYYNFIKDLMRAAQETDPEASIHAVVFR